MHIDSVVRGGWWCCYVASEVDCICLAMLSVFFFFQAEDGIRDLVRSRGLGDVYKRQPTPSAIDAALDERNECDGR